MWDYSEKVKDHFFNPRNAGVLDDANAIGEVGSLACGDALKLMLKIDPISERILDARFQTYGCGSAIASSSALTEMIKGKTIQEALAITNQDIADYLGGLPPEKMHCSVMGREALHAAIANYRGESWHDDHDEGTLICKCFGVSSRLIEETIRANGLTTVEEVTHYTKAGGGCTSCRTAIEEILARIASSREPQPAGKESAPAAPVLATRPLIEKIRRIEQELAAIRPLLARDHGDVELVDLQGQTIYLRLTGACSGCQLESITLSSIQARLQKALGERVRVVPVREISPAAAHCTP
ncbi:MAG: Fe-S cluster assembly protein NifU [Hydrogenophilus sp.]|nr:Fe-S cluster assembly protein NifU [Hydrogenophilus sp.]